MVVDLSRLTDEVDKFIQTHGGYWDTPWLLAAITEELGELSRTLQVYSGIRDTKDSMQKKSIGMLIEEECGDLFFALICLTNFFGIDLETALIKTLGKYNSRREFK